MQIAVLEELLIDVHELPEATRILKWSLCLHKRQGTIIGLQEGHVPKRTHTWGWRAPMLLCNQALSATRNRA